MIILWKVSSFLMRRVVLVRNVGVSLVRCRCLWLPCCILFWVSGCDVLTRDLRITFEDLLCYIYFNVFGWVFIGSCYAFLMGFFPRYVLWRWCMYCWERCLSSGFYLHTSSYHGKYVSTWMYCCSVMALHKNTKFDVDTFSPEDGP
jgi:hypothetical protein